MSSPFDPCWNALPYSLHRWYVDSFLASATQQLSAGTRVLDVGGHRRATRGQFRLEERGLSGVYVNLQLEQEPEVIGDAHQLPFRDGAFPATLCSDVLEHLARPEVALSELARVTAPGGLVFIAVPFLVAVHGHPDDYGRYTETWWRSRLPQVGLRVESLQPFGHYFSVMIDNLRAYAVYGLPGMQLHRRVSRKLIATLLPGLKRLAIRWDGHEAVTGNREMTAFTTGYGVVARRVP